MATIDKDFSECVGVFNKLRELFRKLEWADESAEHPENFQEWEHSVNDAVRLEGAIIKVIYELRSAAVSQVDNGY